MDRNTLLAFLLVAVVLIATPFYMDLVSPPKESKPVEVVKDTPTQTTPSNKTLTHEEIIPEIEVVNLNNDNEKLFTINSDLYTAIISSKNGGSITSFVLNNYKMHDTLLVQLINEFNTNNLLISVKSIDGEDILLNNNWAHTNDLESFTLGSEPLSITFTTTLFDQPIYKILTFYPQSYKIDISTNLRSVLPFLAQDAYSVTWSGGVPVTEKRIDDDITYFKGYVYQGEELYTPKLKKNTDLNKKYIGQTDWVAVRSKYFTSALIPTSKGSAAEINGVHDGVAPRFGVSLYQSVTDGENTSLYLGPLEYDRVKSLGVSLEKIMNFGWSFIRVIAKGVLHLLVVLYGVIPNYGVVLVIFSVLVKIVVYPLTKKSYQSTRKMQEVQPLLNELKEKHKNNPQQLNKATMALYKEKGVNPMGGCLPLLIQMPLLFALFQVFRSTIELRGAPFMLWITDLSAPDTLFYIASFPINILPLLMTVTMLLQQQMTPAQPGQQKSMMYMMNVFFLFIFYRFPSGLNLYYTLFNLLTILQQKYLTPHTPTASTAKLKK